MFDKLIRELRKMERMKVSIQIETDAEGYYDKECPSKNCMFQFKVLAEDWADKFKDESVFCQPNLLKIDWRRLYLKVLEILIDINQRLVL